MNERGRSTTDLARSSGSSHRQGHGRHGQTDPIRLHTHRAARRPSPSSACSPPSRRRSCCGRGCRATKHRPSPRCAPSTAARRPSPSAAPTAPSPTRSPASRRRRQSGGQAFISDDISPDPSLKSGLPRHDHRRERRRPLSCSAARPRRPTPMRRSRIRRCPGSTGDAVLLHQRRHHLGRPGSVPRGVHRRPRTGHSHPVGPDLATRHLTGSEHRPYDSGRLLGSTVHDDAPHQSAPSSSVLPARPHCLEHVRLRSLPAPARPWLHEFLQTSTRPGTVPRSTRAGTARSRGSRSRVGGVIWFWAALLLSPGRSCWRPRAALARTRARRRACRPPKNTRPSRCLYLFASAIAGLAFVLYFGYASFFVLKIVLRPLPDDLRGRHRHLLSQDLQARTSTMRSLPARALARSARARHQPRRTRARRSSSVVGAVALVAFFPRQAETPLSTRGSDRRAGGRSRRRPAIGIRQLVHAQPRMPIPSRPTGRRSWSSSSTTSCARRAGRRTWSTSRSSPSGRPRTRAR